MRACSGSYHLKDKAWQCELAAGHVELHRSGEQFWEGPSRLGRSALQLATSIEWELDHHGLDAAAAEIGALIQEVRFAALRDAASEIEDLIERESR